MECVLQMGPRESDANDDFDCRSAHRYGTHVVVAVQ